MCFHRSHPRPHPRSHPRSRPSLCHGHNGLQQPSDCVCDSCIIHYVSFIIHHSSSIIHHPSSIIHIIHHSSSIIHYLLLLLYHSKRSSLFLVDTIHYHPPPRAPCAMPSVKGLQTLSQPISIPVMGVRLLGLPRDPRFGVRLDDG